MAERTTESDSCFANFGTKFVRLHRMRVRLNSDVSSSRRIDGSCHAPGYIK